MLFLYKNSSHEDGFYLAKTHRRRLTALYYSTHLLYFYKERLTGNKYLIIFRFVIIRPNFEDGREFVIRALVPRDFQTYNSHLFTYS